MMLLEGLNSLVGGNQGLINFEYVDGSLNERWIMFVSSYKLETRFIRK